MGRLPFNTLMTSLLVALLVIKVGDVIGDRIYAPSPPTPHAFPVSGVENKASPHTVTLDTPEDITPFLATAEPARGAKIAQKCVQCHVFAKGGVHRLGPNLWNTLTEKIARLASYAYSRALTKHTGTWTPQALSQYLYKPREFAPGTKMSFVGLKDPQERADVIAYMNQMRDNPTPLTSK